MTDSNDHIPHEQADEANESIALSRDVPGGSGQAVDAVSPLSPTTDFQKVQRRNLRYVGGAIVVLLAMVIIGGFTYRTPYVALVPGSAKDTEPLVEISGTDEYPSDGEVLLTTVRLKTRPNLWSYLWLTMDDDAEILPEEVVLGDRTPDENREVNLQAMTDSKSTAIAVALEQLGVDAIDPTGVFVAEVVDGASADGLLEVGDVVLMIDGAPVFTDLELVENLQTRAPGDRVVLSVERFGTTEVVEIPIVLGARDGEPSSAFLGIAPQTRVRFITDLPFFVDIDSGSVGGPSAGLAFTLAVLDQLTPGELTGGTRVAVTGTISPDGRVGSVGGVPQKAAAVRELGVDVFIVPAALGPETIALVEARAGDGLRIIPVETLQDALDALEALGGDTGALNEFAAAQS